MIRYLKNLDAGLQAIAAPVEGCWVYVIDPSPSEIAQLEAMGIPPDYITYSLDADERARVERENGELLVLLRVPQYLGKSVDIPYSTLPMGIILTPRYFVTVSKAENQVLSDFCSGSVRALSTGKRYRFLLRIMLATANLFLNYLKSITKTVDQIEDSLQKSTRNKELLELLKYQKSLTLFTTALKSNELLLKRLQQIKIFNTYPDDEDLLEDVLTETEQAIEITNIQSNILSSMMDAFASIISNNLNGVMKRLASITILASVPSTIAAFFGMNVIELPFAEYSTGFEAIIGMSLGLTIVLAILFVRGDWL